MNEQRGIGQLNPAPNYDDERLSIRPADYVAEADGKVLNLTPRELALLAEFARNKGRVVTREQLLERVWERDVEVTTRVVDVWVARLRRKLAAAIPEVEYLHTHPTVGYRFGPEPSHSRDPR